MSRRQPRPTTAIALVGLVLACGWLPLSRAAAADGSTGSSPSTSATATSATTATSAKPATTGIPSSPTATTTPSSTATPTQPAPTQTNPPQPTPTPPAPIPAPPSAPTETTGTTTTTATATTAPASRTPAPAVSGAPTTTNGTTATQADDPITSRWLALGGAAGGLGAEVGPRQSVGSGQYQQYANGRIWWSAATGAWETWGSVGARYVAVGGALALGFPTTAEQPVAGGVVQLFSGARIWWSGGTGAWETFGSVGARYLTLGGAAGQGFPTGAEQAVADGVVQSFARIRIWWSGATGAWETLGSVGARYVAIGGASALGFPRGSEQGVAGGAVQEFSGGRIWWSGATGAWETFGSVGARYEALGGAGGQGFPVGDEQAVAGGSVQRFQRISIWWSGGTGAWETLGAIGDRYAALGGAAAVGFPRGPEQGVAGGSGQDFGGTRIWWSGGSGAWETRGSIGDRFLTVGGPTGLGFPLTSEQYGLGGAWQWYTGGVVYWSPARGAWELRDAIKESYVQGGGPFSWYGFPSGAAYGYYGGTRQDFAGGSLLSGVQDVLDATYAPVTASDVWATWRAGCPVGPESLTLVRLNYWGFDNAVHRGEIIVRSDLASRVASIFGTALSDHFPVRKMWRVDYYGGDDPSAMADDNTSGFNCRQVTGGTGLSPHSYGIAIDINTLENPYYAGHWWPTTEYVDRSNVRPGMLFGYSYTTKAFQNNGYAWGASYLDYQHFEYVG